jgi:hypothetical protein
MLTTIIILSVLTLVLGYTSYNLLTKNEKLEDVTFSQEELLKLYENYMNNFSSIIEFSNKKIKEVDAKGSFDSDDEIGFFFKTLKSLQDQLNEFNTKKSNGQ